MDIKLFLDDHLDLVHTYEMTKLTSEFSPIQAEMKSWDYPWRRESLEHYVPFGWSFIALDKDQNVLGYVLAQPLLFFNNWTQNLWVEHLSGDSSEICLELMDVLVRWSKSKHLQKVIVNPKIEMKSEIREKFPKFQEGEYLHLSTTKLAEDDNTV